MELYKTLNNEALDEDLKAKREVMERIIKNASQIDEEIVSKQFLNKEDLNSLTKYILSLNASIDEVFFEIAESKGKVVLNLGDIPYKYNLLVNYIKNLGYLNMDATDKSIIDEKVSKLIPKLLSLENIANEENFIDKFLVPKILENIETKKYNTLYDQPDINAKIKSLKKGVKDVNKDKERKIRELKQKLYALEIKGPFKSKKAEIKRQVAIKDFKEQIIKLVEGKPEVQEEQQVEASQVEAENPEDEDEEDYEEEDYEEEEDEDLTNLKNNYVELKEQYYTNKNKKLLAQLRNMEAEIKSRDPNYFE